MIGFSIMMWFVAILLLFVGISLLKGIHVLMHGRIYDNTNDKEKYAKASGKPVLLLAFGIAVSGVAAVVTADIIISLLIIAGPVIIAAPWFVNIQKRFAVDKAQ